MLSGDDFPRSFNINELMVLSKLFPLAYENFWSDFKRRIDLFYSIIQDGPIQGNWNQSIKKYEWKLPLDDLKNKIVDLFGFNTDFIQFVWDNYLNGQITFVIGKDRTKNPVEFEDLLKKTQEERERQFAAVVKAQRQKEELNNEKIRNLVEEARELRDSYKQKKILKDFSVLQHAHDLIQDAKKIAGYDDLSALEVSSPFIAELESIYNKEQRKRNDKEEEKNIRLELRDRHKNADRWDHPRMRK
jgi:hypothetical protein